MIERLRFGEVPRKHHIQLRGPAGELRFEECFTQGGFDGLYTIMYHLRRPHTQTTAAAAHGWVSDEQAPAARLAKRHFVSGNVKDKGGAPVDAWVPLLYNEDLVCAVAFPSEPDPVYVVNADGDVLIYVHKGGGVLRTMLGDVAFAARDYVFVPRGLLHRFIPNGDHQHWCCFELRGGLHIPKQFRNAAGQLRMDAPYCHRDCTNPTFNQPMDEGIRGLVVKRDNRWHGFQYQDSPLDVVGWDGAVYPWAFPILNFQPRVSSVHLPPTWHGTFAAKGALICSFVPRLVDFHPEAIPCPYPHSSVDCDEILFYCDGNFTSRKGVGPGSISYHPRGVAHGPHPGSYEKSIGTTSTDELAVMLDTDRPLRATAAAAAIEDRGYQESFL